MIGKLLEWLGMVIGGSVWLVITIFMFLSLPFSMIALMRWFDFSIWGALLVGLVINVIPFIGWIAYAVLAVAGCYFFIVSGFSFEKAATPASAIQTGFPSSIQQAFNETCMKSVDRWIKEGNIRSREGLIKAELPRDGSLTDEAKSRAGAYYVLTRCLSRARFSS